MRELGFMQGRLVNQIDGKIQAFPWDEWTLEFPRAAALNLTLIEWTLDQDRLRQNPFMDVGGQNEIKALYQQTGVRVNSLTGDCFMQAPFWKAEGSRREQLLADFDAILDAAAALGVHYVVVPLVDAGRLDDQSQRSLLLRELLLRHDSIHTRGVQVIFETDYGPTEYAKFIAELPADSFNINYDSGNSASLGFDAAEEFDAYGSRIVNVHIKDRLFGGTTVPLGTGAANFEAVFQGLAKLDYRGDFILQTARAEDLDHAGALGRYANMVRAWIDRYYGS